MSELAVRYAALRAEVQRAGMAEGLTRARLISALTAMARANQAARDSALAAYRVVARRRIRPRRRNRLAETIDRILSRIGPLGQALVIARSGVWRCEDPSFLGRMRELAAMAAYAWRGVDLAAEPAALFDQSWYVDANPGVVASGMCPLVHYLLRGAKDGRSPHPLIHAAFYAGRNGPDLGATGLTPLEHFVRIGAAEGRDPHPTFSIEYYVAQAPDLVVSGDNPVSHYVERGWRAGLSPHPLFALDYYVSQILQDERQPPLVHYLKSGSALGLKPHPLFDPDAYRARYPDVTEAGHEPLTHYTMSGGVEGRIPSSWFDAPYYMRQRGPARPADANPLVDYLQGGAWSLSEPWVEPTTVEVSDMTPLERWARQGPARP